MKAMTPKITTLPTINSTTVSAITSNNAKSTNIASANMKPQYAGNAKVSQNYPRSASDPIYSCHDFHGKEIVRIDADGTVVWANGINVDTAAASLTSSFYLGTERMAKITEGVKRRMRDSVFKSMLDIIKEQGDTISVDELTRYWEAAKIMDKLKGPE